MTIPGHTRVWDSYAESYDRILPRLPYYRDAVARHLQAIRASNALAVLDLGAGTGNVTMPLIADGRTVVAVDLSGSMLDRLREKSQDLPGARLTILEQNAQDLGSFDDDSFDAVSILLALYDMAQPERALREAMRVLRPGGTLVVTEPKASFDLAHLLSAGEQYLREQSLLPELADDWARVSGANVRLDPTARTGRMFAEQVAGVLRTAAFEPITITDSHLGECATTCASKH